MIERTRLLSKKEIEGINDLGELDALLDGVDQDIIKIETDLEFVAPDADWEKRARSALAHRRYSKRLLEKRIKDLKPREEVTGGHRPTDRDHPMTRELLGGSFAGYSLEYDFRTVDAPEELELVHEALVARIHCLSEDLDDEMSLAVEKRDRDWLVRARATQREANNLRNYIPRLIGEMRRAKNAREQQTSDMVRERMFVRVAREEFLAKSTYQAIWDRVSQLEEDATARNGLTPVTG